jgi:hypothetical protein
MAGFNVGALPYFIQAQGQLQAQEQAKQQQQMQLMQFQQAQQDRQRQQAAQAAAGNALPQLMAPPPQQPAPQPPAPGQPSQPMQQVGGGVPMPQGPVPGQMQPPPIPQGGPQGQMPPAGVPPFRPMPSAPPQQQAQPTGIPAPPLQQQANPQQDQMEGGFSMANIIQSGQKQGLSGSDLYDYVQTMEPYMTAGQKAKAEQFKTQIELKKLDAEIALHQQASQNQQLSLAERVKHDQALEEAMTRRLDIAESRAGRGGAGGAAPVPEAQGDPLSPKGTAGYSSDAIKALGDDYAVRGPTALAGFGYKNLPPAARAEIVNYAAAKNAASGQNFASNKIQYAADTAGARVNAQQAAKVDAAATALTQSKGPDEPSIAQQFQNAMDALERTGVPVANQAQMKILREKFDPRISTYDTALNAVVSESAQILGRGQITVNSMEEARKVVSDWHTSEQAAAGIAQLVREAKRTVSASSEEVAKSARTPKGQPGIQAGGPAKISSDADYAALPSGAEFIAPDGTHRRKP